MWWLCVKWILTVISPSTEVSEQGKLWEENKREIITCQPLSQMHISWWVPKTNNHIKSLILFAGNESEVNIHDFPIFTPFTDELKCQPRSVQQTYFSFTYCMFLTVDRWLEGRMQEMLGWACFHGFLEMLKTLHHRSDVVFSLFSSLILSYGSPPFACCWYLYSCIYEPAELPIPTPNFQLEPVGLCDLLRKSLYFYLNLNY